MTAYYYVVYNEEFGYFLCWNNAISKNESMAAHYYKRHKAERERARMNRRTNPGMLWKVVKKEREV